MIPANYKEVAIRSVKKAVLLTPLSDIIILHRLKKEFQEWERNGKPDVLPNLMKQGIVEEYARRFRLTTLIETGTNMGAMVSAMKATFKRIVSIELEESLYARAKRKFRRFSHITIIQGDSSEVLGDLLPTLVEPCLFWLDAHYSGGLTAKGPQETPIVKELLQVLAHPVAGHIILIDDIRCFTGQNDYPAISKIREIVCQSHPDWVFESRQDIMRIHASSPKSDKLASGSSGQHSRDSENLA